jgi:hypothetical protein
MKYRHLLSGILLATGLAGTPTALRAEPANQVWWTADITANTTWYNTNVYLMHGLVHVLAPATLTIQPGTVIKGISEGSITNGEPTSALFVTAGAKIHAVGTPTRPIIFTSEFDDTDDPTDLGIYERGLWGGLVVMGNAVLNTSSSGAGNVTSPKYDVFEGLPDNQINGQFVYRFGGNNDTDNSGEIQYVSIRHGGYVITGNKELNGLSMCALGSGTTIDHVEAYAIADDGFEWFGGTVNTKYLVSAFNDDDCFDTDQGYRGKNQFWFAIQENLKRDNGGEWNGEPNGIAVSNAPFANFQVYNATWVGPGAGVATNSNNGLFIREYSAPRVFNSILTEFNNNGGTVGIKMDTKSGAMLAAGLLTVQETIVNGFTTTFDANSAPLFSNAALSNSTVNPLLTSISRTPNHLLDPRLQAASPALVTGIVPPNDGFYQTVKFKGAFSQNLWAQNWTALAAYGILTPVTTIGVDATVTALPTAPTLTITPSGGNVLVTYPSQSGFSYQLKSVTDITSTNWVNEGGSLPGTGGTLTNTAASGNTEKYFRVLVQ